MPSVKMTRRKFAPTAILSVFVLPPILALSSEPSVIRSYSLFETSEGQPRRCIGRCVEVVPPPRDPLVGEDEVEMWYSTNRRSFLFPPEPDSYDSEEAPDLPSMKRIDLRETSFGCGRLGATVWPSGIALASMLSGPYRSSVEGAAVLELGAGCGLPSLTCRDVSGAASILATDYWEEDDGTFDADRLVPKGQFGTNLIYNLGDEKLVDRLDWHDKLGVIVSSDRHRPSLVIGSDLVYEQSDLTPLMSTLDTLLKTSAKEALLLCPLPPNAVRKALPDFRSRMEKGEIDGCTVVMDEVELLEDDDFCHHFLRVRLLK